MRVIINGHPHQAPGAMSLAQAVALLTSAESGVAAAVKLTPLLLVPYLVLAGKRRAAA